LSCTLSSSVSCKRVLFGQLNSPLLVVFIHNLTVKPEMFPIMGDALLLTLETTLKGDFTEPIREAWIETYKALSQDMIRAQIKAKNIK
jgi:hemoglobin-like flavoprotein